MASAMHPPFLLEDGSYWTPATIPFIYLSLSGTVAVYPAYFRFRNGKRPVY